MRINILLFVLSFIIADSFAQKDSAKNNSFKFLAKPDSIITKRQEGYIYLITDTTAIMYDWLIPNPNDEFVVNVFADYINHIKTSFKQNLVINNIKGFPRKWNQVHVYRNKFYVYSPSDWMWNSGYYISDSVIYMTKSDPDDLYFILDFKNVNTDLSEFQIINYFGEHKTIRIQLISSQFGIYVWTFLNQKNEIESRHLYQDSRFAKKLPMIVCDCGENKCYLEFEFDNPDFDKLIKKE